MALKCYMAKLNPTFEDYKIGQCYNLSFVDMSLINCTNRVRQQEV